MRFLRAYGFSLLLVAAIGAGAAVGIAAPAVAEAIRPIGDLFLNLVFMVIVPLVFFTVAASIAGMGGTQKLSRIARNMVGAFLLTSAVAAVGALLFMTAFPPVPGAGLDLAAPEREAVPSFLAQLVKSITVSDFPELISRKAMLPLILFSVLVGLAASRLGERAEAFTRFLAAGAQVFIRIIGYVMWVAPVGLLAYFAATVVDTGAELASAYLTVFWVYYAFAALYFLAGFTAYAFAAGRLAAVRRFWAHVLPPALTAAGTCSSMATLPANLAAAPRMGIPGDVRDVVLPIGAALHKDGSVIGGVAKILFLFAVFQIPLDAGHLALAAGVAVLVGVVMGAIPSGGLIGEMLILSVFGFPAEALPLIAVISVIIDPAATLLNATGDNAAAMLVARWTDGKGWGRDAAAPTAGGG